jgi:hypothetical protein
MLPRASLFYFIDSQAARISSRSSSRRDCKLKLFTLNPSGYKMATPAPVPLNQAPPLPEGWKAEWSAEYNTWYITL